VRHARVLTWLVSVPVVAACYWGVYILLIGITFSIGDAATLPHGPWEILTDLLVLVVTVLGFPFMAVPSSARGLALSREMFGDDSAALVGLITLNSLLWSVLIIALAQYVRRRRTGWTVR
jgi:hypothetical protein